MQDTQNPSNSTDQQTPDSQQNTPPKATVDELVRMKSEMNSSQNTENTPTQPATEQANTQGINNIQPQQTDQQALAGQGTETKVDLEPPSLSEAPESFKRRAPSTFKQDPNIIGKKPRKKRTFCLFGCIILVILILIVGGIGAYAYYTKTEILIISDIIGKIEELIKSPKSEALKVQDKFAQTVIGVMMPMITEDENFVSSFAQSDISEESIKGMLTQYEEIKSFKFDLEMDADSYMGSEGDYSSFLGENFEVKIEGGIDYIEEGNDKAQVIFDIYYPDGDLPIDVDGELRLIGKDTFLKLNNTEDLLEDELEMSLDIDGKWIDLGYDDAESTSDLFREDVAEEEDLVSSDDIQKLVSLLTDESVIKNVEFMDDEIIEGNDCLCLKAVWNKEELKEVLKTYSTIYGIEYDEEEINSSLEDVTNTTLEFCVNKESYMLHRIKLLIEGEVGGNAASLELNLKLWDYEVPLDISAPVDAVDFDEILEQAMGYSYDDLASSSQDALLKSQMLSIQLEVEMYYLDNTEYPDDLDMLDLDEYEFDLSNVNYLKTGESYRLWTILSDGEEYELSSEY